jgi:hypothetical protein
VAQKGDCKSRGFCFFSLENVVCTRKRIGEHRILVGKHEGKKPLGRPRRRLEDNVKMDLQEIGCGPEVD